MAIETGDRLIKGGTIVDGTGAEPIAGDLRIRDGVIVEIAQTIEPEPGEEVFDASGCHVTPGFIESHTHYDGAMWWQSDLDPLPGYGVTSMVMGNCGFGLAPLSDDPAIRDEVIQIFSFFEDFPEAPFHEHVPWDWRSWSEYKRSMVERLQVPIHYATFTSHITLRLAVMGLEAWERAATPQEVARMSALLEDALEAGALGLASNLFDHDGDDRPIPTMHAEDEEFRALFEVVARYPGASFQVPVDNIMRMTAAQSVERIAKLSEGLDLRVQWAGLPNEMWQKQAGIQAPMAALHERFAAEGRDFWTAYMHAPITTSISLEKSLLFTQSGEFVWHEVIEAETESAKRALLEDPEWRARARTSWDEDCNETAPFRNPEPLILELSDNGVGPVDTTLGKYAAEGGLHCSDALAEWMLANGLGSTVRLPDWDKDVEMTLRLLRDPYSVGNLNDSGAHGQMFCGAGDNVLLLTKWVRDEGLLKIEEGVHVLTGKLARHFGFLDRGELTVGKRADVVVFDLDEIEHRPKRKVHDLPDGKGGTSWRYSRDPAPVRLTLVDGIATFEDGKPTTARPGTMLEPSAPA
jgi:N-acyl-D-aspartate/D-glutamate deacylase